MAIGNINNSSGIGYTQMTGLGLTSAVQSQVKINAAVSDSTSEDILRALAEFRTEGVLRPTSAQMAAKLAAYEVQRLIDGVEQILANAMTTTGRAANDFTLGSYEFGETVGSSDPAVRSQYFGSAIGAHAQYHVDNLVAKYTNHPISHYQIGNSGAYHNGAISNMLADLQSKLSELQSQSNVSTTPGAGNLSAQEWLGQLGFANARDSYSLQQWGEMAQQLQVDAAKQKSQLSIGNGGGIQQVNGQYFVNGEMMSLSQVNFCVRANQYQLIDQQIADQMNAVQQNNEKAKKANALLAAFKSAGINSGLANEQTGTELANDLLFHSSSGLVRLFLASNYPEPPAHAFANYNFVINGWNHNEPLLSQVKDTMALLKAAAPDFYSKYVRDTNGSTPYSGTGSVTYADWDAAKTAISTYLSQNSTDNQVAQQRLESLNNTRQSILTGMSAFTQGQSQLTDRIGGNL